MKRKVIIPLIAVLSILIVSLLTYLNSRYINPTDFHVTYLDVEDNKVPTGFDNCSIAFFSDLEFGTYFDQERLQTFAEQINSLSADIVIFGGDLFDRNYSPVSGEVTELTRILKSIKANKGKYAILGDFDQTSEQRRALIQRILFDADYELLNGNPIIVHNNSSEFINIVGFDYMDYQPEMNDVFNTVDTSVFTLTVVHGAKFAEMLPIQTTSMTLSGHGHHMQINFPLFVDFEEYPATGKYGVGKIELKNTKLYVSHGVGTTGTDHRLFCDPEIVFIRFKK